MNNAATAVCAKTYGTAYYYYYYCYYYYYDYY